MLHNQDLTSARVEFNLIFKARYLNARVFEDVNQALCSVHCVNVHLKIQHAPKQLPKFV